MAKSKSKKVNADAVEKETELVCEEGVNAAEQTEETSDSNPEIEQVGNTEAVDDLPAEIVLTSDEFKAVKERIDKLEADKADAVHQAQRLQAEFDNYRKRNASLAADCRDDGVRDIIKQLLPVIDNFERALQNAEDTPFSQGVVIIARQLNELLSKCGLEEIPAEGKFDPTLHDAVMQDNAEGVDSGVITEVLQKGYSVKGRIIRHTMVKVNQ